MQGGGRITLKGAQVQKAFEDNVPAVITETIGKGKAVLLNLSIADYNIVSFGGVGGEEEIVMVAQHIGDPSLCSRRRLAKADYGGQAG